MGEIRSGLVSISFRNLSVQAIVELVARSGQHAIEWGGDVHVPHGDRAAARTARIACENAGIETPSYGSYFKLGRSAAEGVPFASVVLTASELSAETIRIWAGSQGSAETSADTRKALVDEAYACAELARGAGMTLSLEYHGGTLTDTGPSAIQFLEEVDHPALKSYWQPRTGGSTDRDHEELERVAPFLSNVHVFHWHDHKNRMTLAEGRRTWAAFLERIAAVPGKRYALLEFVKDDDPDQYLADAATLAELLHGANQAAP
jgi:sugar phosphate isomerase/epimerase